LGAGISDDRIGLITFTRCGAAAKVLQRKAGLKKRMLELGSNSLEIVLSDAAVQSCVSGACSASGQNYVGVK
jgi:glyceraldehyde-3-phosphate dehydrogenase (NADP+)